jgi:hypothetical protein
MGRAKSLSRVESPDPVFNRFQDHLRDVLTPLLSNPANALADWRLTEGTSGLTVQHRVNQTWTTIYTIGTAGSTVAGTLTVSTASAGLLTQEAWTAVTFLNSWVNFDATTYQSAAYFKDSLGVVHLRGRIKNGTINTAAFTLPVGYRPLKTCLFPSLDGVSAAAILGVDTGGNVIPVTGNNGSYLLDGITFDARA